MKKILLSMAGFCALASFAVNTKQQISVQWAVLESMVFECPECTKQYEKYTKPLYEAYLKECSAACDKFKEGKLTREEYEKICNDANNKNKEPDMACMTTFNNCCLKETKDNMDMEQQDKESVN